MSESPSVPTPKGVPGIFKRKVAGVPVLYLVAGFVVILAVVAWKMKPSSDLEESDSLDAVDEESDAALASGSGDSAGGILPAVPNGTVIVAPSTPEPDEAPYEDNSTWMRKAVAFLIAKGFNPGDAQLAMQAYLSGAQLSYQQGQMRDVVVREFGLPPNDFEAGTTLAKPVAKPPVTPTTPKPVTPKPPVKAPPKPTPPKTRTHIVRPGDNLTKIANQYKVRGGWQAIYAVPANRKVIGSNPNLIKPGQRLVIP